jgi:hypothetical protein
MPPDTDDLRSTLESAFDAAETPETAAPEPVESPTERTAPVDHEDRGDGRTPAGRFARPKPADAAADAVVDRKPNGEDAEQKPVADPFVRAPQSWKPGAREAWTQLPPNVREEVYRRERETMRVAQESAQARELAGHVNELTTRYAPALQAEGVDTLTAAHNLFQTASQLRFGSPAEKAQTAARIIRAYGVDVMALAAVLDNMPLPQGGGQVPQFQDPRVDQLLGELNQAKQQRVQTLQAQATGEVEQFGADKDFFDDVRLDMADIMEMAANRGIDLSLQQAYDRACAMHPEVSKVLAARVAAQQAGTARQSTQRARLAASSVRGTPSGVSTTAPPDTVRSAIEAAIEQVGER